jgi:oxygen-independent coproporphyrinogen III oxidase
VRPIIDHGPGGPPASLYVHLPFCRERCLYCSFPTVADDPGSYATLIDALLAEAQRQSDQGVHLAPLETVYLGGGTPGLLPAALLERLLSMLLRRWPALADVEITLEANPANVTEQSLSNWSSMGVRRLSLGVQTFRDDVLARLGRRHDAARGLEALKAVGRWWPHTWSADLLAGWAGQSLADLDADIARLTAAQPPHVSVYALTIEDGTPLAAMRRAGRVVSAAPALEPALDARCTERLDRLGYERYEVSNFAQPGHRSRHNQVYWADRSYLGLGPGAASSVHPYRWVNRADLPGYLQAARSAGPLRAGAERIDPESRLVEVLGVGLRTRDGLACSALDRRFGVGVAQALAIAGEQLVAEGWLTLHDDRLRIPAERLSTADAIVAELIAQPQPEPAPAAGPGR